MIFDQNIMYFSWRWWYLPDKGAEP